MAFFSLSFGCCAETLHDREDVREMYAALTLRRGVSPYQTAPVIAGEYASGSLTPQAQADAQAYLNFIRELAYLEGEVALEPVYALRAQHAAALLAANDELTHDPARAPGMSDGFYQTAWTGASASNIAAINWMDEDVLLYSLEYFVRDDGEANLTVLGHRRWLLSPYLGRTGFGLANSQTGMSYTAMYVHDFSAEPGQWENVKWPSAGAFPAELMSYDIAWSVVLNMEEYSADLSNVHVSMYEQSRGPASLSFFSVNTEAYGAGPCIIFMPDLEKLGIYDYQQNQLWHVRIDGLKTVDGAPASIEYAVEMVSLYPVDPVAVEAEPRALSMTAGDVCLITAQVVPEWADDVSVTWRSTDEGVAVVDESGYVTAVAAGECEIIAEAVNGRSDTCRVSVETR